MKSCKLPFVLAIILFAFYSVNAQNWQTTGNNAGQNDVLGTTNNQTLNVETNDTVRIYVKPDGNVGLGTDKTTGYKLSVDGKVRAREVVVNMDSWADFVFDLKYNLISLDSLKSYIQTNNSLPGVPKENEVCKEGVSVGEMNKILLQKVEELTLYMIQMQKEIEEMQAEMDAGSGNN